MKHTRFSTIFAATFAAITISSRRCWRTDSSKPTGTRYAAWPMGANSSSKRRTATRCEGYCVSVDVNGLGVKTKDGQVKHIARTALARLDSAAVERAPVGFAGQGSPRRPEVWFQFSALAGPPGRGGDHTGNAGVGSRFDTFCILGDLRDKLAGSQEIKVI